MPHVSNEMKSLLGTLQNCDGNTSLMERSKQFVTLFFSRSYIYQLIIHQIDQLFTKKFDQNNNKLSQSITVDRNKLNTFLHFLVFLVRVGAVNIH